MAEPTKCPKCGDVLVRAKDGTVGCLLCVALECHDLAAELAQAAEHAANFKQLLAQARDGQTGSQNELLRLRVWLREEKGDQAILLFDCERQLAQARERAEQAEAQEKKMADWLDMKSWALARALGVPEGEQTLPMDEMIERVKRLREALAIHKHTDKCLDYAVRTAQFCGQYNCIAECADSHRKARAASEGGEG